MRWLGVAALLALALLAGGAFGLSIEPAVKQPVEFPHKTHVELNLDCTSCHEDSEKDAAAGVPPTEFCLTCHSGGEVKGEARKVQAFGEKGVEIPWRRVWRLPSHVYFSHGTHVSVAKLKCQTCHGPIETLTRPPARPMRKLTMNDCIGCHEAWPSRAERPEAVAQRVSTDCNACHR